MKPASFSGPRRPFPEAGRASPLPLGSGFLGLVRRTALLNLGVVLSAFVIALLLRNPAAGVMILALVIPVVSLLLWGTAFAVFGAVTTVRVFNSPRMPGRKPAPQSAPGSGVGDAWLDGPR